MVSTPPEHCKDGFLYDIVDGSLFNTHPLFSMRPSALQLILYSDEIELCNPLGPHISGNKLLMFYYTIGNIDPKFRLKIGSIRLLAIAKAKDISGAKVEVILKRIEKDLKQLYEGVEIKMGSDVSMLYGAVISICGSDVSFVNDSFILNESL